MKQSSLSPRKQIFRTILLGVGYSITDIQIFNWSRGDRQSLCFSFGGRNDDFSLILPWCLFTRDVYWYPNCCSFSAKHVIISRDFRLDSNQHKWYEWEYHVYTQERGSVGRQAYRVEQVHQELPKRVLPCAMSATDQLPICNQPISSVASPKKRINNFTSYPR